MAMSGRSAQTLREQAERYGLPFGTATIELPALARALHDFLADRAGRLARAAAGAGDLDADELAEGSPALERFRLARAKLAELELARQEHDLVSRDQVRQALATFAGILRQAGETLQRQCGADAYEILSSALDDAETAFARQFDAPTQDHA